VDRASAARRVPHRLRPVAKLRALDDEDVVAVAAVRVRTVGLVAVIVVIAELFADRDAGDTFASGSMSSKSSIRSLTFMPLLRFGVVRAPRSRATYTLS
jgi:hypothetical protein